MVNSSSVLAFRLSRAGSLETNPTLLRQRAAAALSDVSGNVTFITIREGAALGHYVVLDDTGNAERSAFAIGRTVSANVQPAEAPDLSRVKSVVQLVHERGSVVGYNPQVGADIQAVSDVAASSLRDGEWVAFAVRHPSRSETKRNRRWLEHRGTVSHHSLEVNAVILSMWAGGESTSTASSILRRIAGALPGFDLRTRAVALSRVRTASLWAGAAALGAAATFLPFPWAAWAWVPAAAAALVAVGIFTFLLPSSMRSTYALLARGQVPAARRRLTPPAPPKRSGIDKNGNPVPAADGDYPLHEGAFLVGPAAPISVVAPHAGAESGSETVRSRVAPPALREPVGPLIGMSEGTPAHLSAADAWSGYMALGEAGSGKSALLQAQWGYDAAVKAGRIRTPDGRGREHTMIAFDTKNDSASADQYVAWSQAYRDPVYRFDVSDETSDLGIELFPTTGSAVNRARRMTSALKYVFGETSIGPESFDTITRVFIGAFAVTDPVLSMVPHLPRGKSPFFYANILLTSRGDDLGKQLADAIRMHAERTGDEDALEATAMLGTLYDPQRTPSQRQQLVKAPRNKLEQLCAAEHWWSRPKRASWASLLEKNTTVVINFGAVEGASGELMMTDEETASQIAGLMMYTLRDEIQRSCIGWFEERRMVSIYADELKHIAGKNSAVVSWIRNDARSFGARGVFATQFPKQLDPEVRSTVMGFGTLVAFSQKDTEVIRDVLSAFGGEQEGWERTDLYHLQNYHAIVRTTLNGAPQPAFTIAIPDFRSMRGEEFLSAQGVPVETSAPAEPEAPSLGHDDRLPDPADVAQKLGEQW